MSVQTGQVQGRPTSASPETGLKTDKIMSNENKISTDILSLNGLNYSVPDNNSVVVRRTLIRSTFSNSTYTSNANAIVNLNTGNDYVYGKNSYLCFQLGINAGYTGTAATDIQMTSPAGALTYDARFGRGSAANIINNAVFTSSSGTEVERVVNGGQHIAFKDRIEMSDDWLKTYGGVMGYKWYPHSTVNVVNVPTVSATAASTGLASTGTSYLAGPPVGYATYSSAGAGAYANPPPTPASGCVDFYPLMDDGSGNGGWYGDSVLYNANGVAGTNATISAKGPNVIAYGSGASASAAATSSTMVSTSNGSYDYNKPQAKWFCIPLSRIFGMFNTDKLIPNSLIGGGRLELTFNPGTLAFMWKGCDPTNISVTNSGYPGYTIQNLSAVMDCVQLSDTALVKLNSISAKYGLDLAFETFSNVESTAVVTTSINIDNKLAVSRGNWAYYRMRRAISTGNNGPLDLATCDSYASFPSTYNSYQFQLAGMYFPQQFVGNSSTNTNGVLMTNYDGKSQVLVNAQDDNEQYLNFLYCAGKLSDQYGTSTINARSYSKYDSCGICTLERSCMLNYSGVPVSTARILTFRAYLSTVPTVGGTAVGIVQDLNLMYWRIGKCYLNKIIMRE